VSSLLESRCNESSIAKNNEALESQSAYSGGAQRHPGLNKQWMALALTGSQPDLRRVGASEYEQLRFAAEQGRAIYTFNASDFALLRGDHLRNQA
jgi:hypothetical protein